MAKRENRKICQCQYVECTKSHHIIHKFKKQSSYF